MTPFEKFTGEYMTARARRTKPTPASMVVGEIVVRKNCRRTSISGLRSLMRRAMREHGMEFSVELVRAEKLSDGMVFSIRRDK